MKVGIVKKPKKLTYSKSKKAAWDAFSKYIRLRDCTDGVGDQAFGSCFTCGRRYEFKKLQAGHFLNGRHNSILFDERGTHAQCKYCNIILKGNQVKYTLKMQEIYGQKVIDELIKLDTETRKYKIFELVLIKETYEQKYTNMV